MLLPRYYEVSASMGLLGIAGLGSCSLYLDDAHQVGPLHGSSTPLRAPIDSAERCRWFALHWKRALPIACHPPGWLLHVTTSIEPMLSSYFYGGGAFPAAFEHGWLSVWLRSTQRRAAFGLHTYFRCSDEDGAHSPMGATNLSRPKAPKHMHLSLQPAPDEMPAVSCLSVSA
ncbi:hypothetical protein N658DRAFT_265603 [Parathielavia hyrcaniae]|uniref:Uncharacterized protein n=1 Tax=Parathielavia hyrcaniae TaxID=113614 RepID=A0AAN6PTZ2_9PEZI|nr:hypothetical protein N658DRAFT_265603 [Parathielavia hyrcaniae]